MRVLIVPQAPYFIADGGMEIHQKQTISALRRVGVEVVLLDLWEPNITVDLVHVFGSEHVQSAIVRSVAARGLPIVTTAMFMPVQAGWKHTLFNLISHVFPVTLFEKRREIIQRSSRVIVLTDWEGVTLRKYMAVPNAEIITIPNGVEDRFFHASKDLFVKKYGFDDFVLCASRIEHRKNQVSVAKAMAGTGIPTIFIGAEVLAGVPDEQQYLREFHELIANNDNLHWLGKMEHDDPLLASAYAAARVHVLATKVDAAGMVTFEAAAAGCSIVVGDIPTQREMFGTSVQFVDPYSVESIRSGITAVYSKGRGSVHPPRSLIVSWDDVARQIVDVYKQVLTA